jgi:hypothetical protein
VSLSGADTIQKKHALAIAENWLTIIEKGEYGESWKEAAEYFKTAVPEEKWVWMLQAVRTPLGKLISRKVKTAIYKTSLSGGSRGEILRHPF